MNHSVTIQSWARLLGKIRLNLSISYHFVVISVQKVNFELFRGLFWASLRPIHLTMSANMKLGL